MYSQNGYKANDWSLIATYTIPGTTVKISLRKGDVSVVLLHFAAWFNKNISSLSQKDTGGYSDRPIRNSKVVSNHASGTAEDLDWNAHPQGKKNTFTAAQQKKIRAQLKYYDGVIRWGGDYVVKKDDMHFEINKNLASVKLVADKIRKDSQPKPIPKPSPPPHSLMFTGVLDEPTIRRWQQIMGTPIDGKIDPKDSLLIRAVQKRLQATVDHRIVIDGAMGTQTVAGVQRYLKSPVDGYITTPVSEMVKALQRRLNTGNF